MDMFKEKNITIRNYADTSFRITIGTNEENEMVLDVLRRFEYENSWKNRDTKETKIYEKINLDGNGNSDIGTGIGFFDHMLTLFAFHSNFDLVVKADGDLEVCDHHTIEDCGILLGKLFLEALEDKKELPAMEVWIFLWMKFYVMSH